MSYLENMSKAILLLLLGLTPFMAKGENIEVNGIYYNLVEKAKAAEVTVNPEGYYYESIIVPESIEYEGVTYTVEAISDYAFANCNNIKTISIPNTITHIGTGAFQSSRGLTDIVIPNSVKDIGIYAFFECKGLKSATIGNGVSLLSDYLFCKCDNLESISLGNGILNIGRDVFYRCDNLKSVYISDLESWFNIDFKDYALFSDYHLFLNGVEIKELVIPTSVKSIPDNVFSGCSGLTSIIFHDNITSIESGAFRDCYGLTSINIPSSVTSIGSGAFLNCI